MEKITRQTEIKMDIQNRKKSNGNRNSGWRNGSAD